LKKADESSGDSFPELKFPASAQNNAENLAEEELENNNYEEYLPNSFTFSHQFKNKKLKSDLRARGKPQRDNLIELMRAVVICHNATRKQQDG
jgi:hypothetical protein